MRTKSFTTIIEFPKIAFKPTTRKTNAVEVRLELNYQDYGEVQFHVIGYVWNTKHGHTILGGQCLEELFNYFGDNALFREVYNLWKRWHMNHMRTGTAEQIEAIIKWNEKHPGEHMCYDSACAYLKSIGLYEVPHPEHEGQTFTYGEQYLYEEIPAKVIAQIKRVMKHNGYWTWENGKGHFFEPDTKIKIA